MMLGNESVLSAMKNLHLLYHELRSVPSDYTYVTECAEFERHCALFAERQQDSGRGLRPVVTFDDGHRSNYEFALPMLQRQGLRARFFITVGWTGERSEYMNWNELRSLHAAGQAVGAHGWSHKLLTHCTRSELDQELVSARLRLEDGLGSAIHTMSLPGGRSNHRVLEACWNAGYTEVFTSEPRAEPDIRPARATTGRLNLHHRVSTEWLERVLDPADPLLRRLEREDHLKRFGKRLLGDRLYARLWALLNREERQAETVGKAVG